MASVHFARLLGPSGFARTVAVKRAHPHLAQGDDYAHMFLDEARLAARIQHANVVPTLDALKTPTELLLVMEYVHGESLWKLARAVEAKGERVPVGIAASILIDTLHGLHAAHEAKDEQGVPLNIVHRDVSPHNILVGADGVTRLVDFGIAKAAGRLYSTRDNSVKGKYAYMAPEQARGEEVSRLSDTYAAAIVFWELLTGERLFSGKTEAETIHKSLVSRVRRPSMLVPGLDPRLDALLERGLSRDPAGRYATAREMALEIEACVAPVRASEVASWVEKVAGSVLAKRARVIAELEAIPSEEPTPVSTSGLAAATTIAEPPRVRGKATWVAVALAAAGLLAAVALVAHREGEPSEALPAIAWITPGLSVSASTPQDAPPASAAPSVVVPAAAPPAAALASPTKPREKTHAAHPAHASSCDPPYSIDATGRRIFKAECMQ